MAADEVADLSSPESRKVFEAEVNEKISKLQDRSRKLASLRKKLSKKDLDSWADEVKSIDAKVEAIAVLTRLSKTVMQEGKAPCLAT